MTRQGWLLPLIRRATVATIAAALVVVGSVSPASAETEDGGWEVGEFALWEHTNLTGGIFDNAGYSIGSYKNIEFINTNRPLNDKASSTGNGRSHRMCAWEHAGSQGSHITHLPYGQNAGSLGYAYSSLGWANDRLSSHGDWCP